MQQKTLGISENILEKLLKEGLDLLNCKNLQPRRFE